jgi:hypothetical protein
MCGQGLFVNVWLVRMFCHIGSQANTAEISSHMIWQSYRKMYHWQSEHECAICMMVLRHILAVLCEMFSVNTCHDRCIGRGGPIAWPPHPTPDLDPLDFYPREHRRILVLTMKRHFTIALWMPVRLSATTPTSLHRSITRLVEVCIESDRGNFEHLL